GGRRVGGSGGRGRGRPVRPGAQSGRRAERGRDARCRGPAGELWERARGVQGPEVHRDPFRAPSAEPLRQDREVRLVTSQTHLAADLEEARRWVAADLPAEDVERLFEPIRVGSVVIPNRFVMSAMGARFADSDGQVTDRQVAYYATRARGGVGSIIVEGSSVHPSGTTYANKPRLYDERLVAGLRRLADAIRSEGAVPGIQLMHAGRH